MRLTRHCPLRKQATGNSEFTNFSRHLSIFMLAQESTKPRIAKAILHELFLTPSPQLLENRGTSHGVRTILGSLPPL
jgi:hypothetical protein